ncbi:MAG: sensor histidine kinase [Pseudomonadota bacterium]
MTQGLSLRARLTFVILIPLICVAIIVGAWAYFDAQRNAADRFDRSLLSTALAISRDIAATGGDALSEETRDLLRDTSGGAVFYHVYAPDGAFVTGYATPPVAPSPTSAIGDQQYYDAIYLGNPVRALRLTQTASVDGLSGLFTYTVWQATDVRDGFVLTRTVPVFAIIASMIGALAIIVWFGVARGLAPLINLEEAIARRSVDDLSPIRRKIPPEVSGIVSRFNDLLGDLSASMKAKDAFISDAAHQLRNPIAGVISLADSVHKARDLEAAKTRAADLHDASLALGQLTNSLLTLERLNAGQPSVPDAPFEATRILSAIADRMAPVAAARNVRFISDLPQEAVSLRGDPVMFEQAVLNLIDNAFSHGGETLSEVALLGHSSTDALCVTIRDDGKGLAEEHLDRALARFSQIGPSAGSGLGLPIAAAILDAFGGTIELTPEAGTFAARLTFPRVASSV